MMMKEKLLYILLIVLMSGCKKETLPSMDDVINMNPRLSEVLQKYESDSLKQLAAEFLIINLPYYYSYEGVDMEHYMKLYEIFGAGLNTLEEVRDSVEKKYGNINFGQLITKSDVDISPEYLMNNIEWAFKVWKEQPWGKNVPFEDFCEYILPYRIKDEPLKDWREEIYNEFNPMLDSIRNLPEAEDPLFVSSVLLDSIAKSKKKFVFSSSLGYGPHIGPDLVKWRSGNCRESADLLTYIFRAVGIPCGCDYMPLRGDGNVAHFWNFTLDKDGESYYMYEGKKPEPVRNFYGVRSKVYRQTFGLNKNMVERMKGNMERVYPTFQYPGFLDVTRLYSGKNARTFTIPYDKLYFDIPDDEIVYLCSSSKMEWKPMSWAYPEEDGFTFEEVEGRVVFLLAVYRSKRLIPVSDPFELNKETGGIYYFSGSKEKEEVKLLNKFNQFIESYPNRMINGVFEGSNYSDFRQKDTLFIIKDYPLRLHNVVILNNAQKYRYVRYMGPNGCHCNVSEVSFYENKKDSCVLKGEIIGTSNEGNGDGKHDFYNVYDGDPYTSFDYYLPTGGWAGLDLKHARNIGKIIFTPRNRDNYIRKGDVYELFYFSDGKWVTANKQVAKADSLLYKVPEKTLLYLKNHSYGTDERIFEFKDGIQQYW